MDEINLNGTTTAGGNSSSDDEVVVGEDDELTENKDSVNATSTSNTNNSNGFSVDSVDMNAEGEKANTSNDLGFFKFDPSENVDLFADRPLPIPDLQAGGSSLNPFLDNDDSDVVNLADKKTEVTNSQATSPPGGDHPVLPNGSSPSTDSTDGSASSEESQRSAAVPSLFEEDVEFVGVELEGTEKAMEQALKEGIVGEAGPLKRNISPKAPEKENPDEGGAGIKEFNDANYWRVDQEVAVLE